MLSKSTVMVLFGLLLSNSVGICATYDDKTPLSELKSASEAGDAAAMVLYGERLLEGNGIEKSEAEGLKWIEAAAKKGNGDAFYDLSVMYLNAQGVVKNVPKALAYLEQGAALNNTNCMTSLGMLNQAGPIVDSTLKVDMPAAIKWYTKGAELNHTESIQHLAMIYIRGMGVDRNPKEAAKWFKKGAELGNGDCQWGYGQCLFDGAGEEKDLAKGFAWLTLGVENCEVPPQKTAMAKRLGELAEKLSADQKAASEALLKELHKRFNK